MRGMGNATSSAMRADDPVTPASAAGDDGPAFGSLASLGGPKKFKKKPVLVLDPEELEKAHMMFQDASAEMLGEEVQRPERPSSILGLAPMDDEDSSPEDMGAPDEGEDNDDGDIPSAEDLLRMAASRPALDEDDEAMIAAQLEGLDLDHRIFPNLPLKSEDEIAAEEEAERTRAGESDEPAETPVAADPGDTSGEDEDLLLPIDNEHGAAYEYEYEADGESEQSDDGENPYYARLDMPFVDPLPEPEADLDPAPQPHEVDEQAEFGEDLPQVPPFGEAPFLEFPAGPLSWRPVDVQPHDEPALSESDAEPAREEKRADETGFEPAPEFAPEPFLDNFTEVEDPSNRFEWELEEVTEDGQPVHAMGDPKSVHEYEDEYLHEETDDAQGHYTEVDDEPVDGYAFMYSANPRARTLNALAEGESNSLRARLIREREQAEAESESRKSLLAKFTGWLRGLFG